MGAPKSAAYYEKLGIPDRFRHVIFEGPHEFHDEAAWEFVMPILDHWARSPGRFLPEYRAGTWGPLEADRLIEADGREWRTL